MNSRDADRTPALPRALRRAGLGLAAALLACGVLLVAGPAGADVPEGWTGTSPSTVDKFHALLILAGIPIGLALVISLLVLAPGLARGEGLIGTEPDRSTWLGGPTDGLEALPAGDPTAPAALEKHTGGSSGQW